jgi:hypothetical protein
MKVLRAYGIQFVFHQVTKSRCFICRPGANHAEFYTYVDAGMVNDRNTVFIVDTGAKASKAECLDSNAFTVVIASPHAAGVEVIKEFVEKPIFAKPKLYMSGWSEDELQVCRRVIAPTAVEEATDKLQGMRLPVVNAATVAKRFRRFGGVVRIALSQSSDELLESKLREAIEACKLDVISSHLSLTLDLMPAASSWILHYVVDDQSFDLKDIVFASPSICSDIYADSKKQVTDTVLSFLHATSGMPTWSGARGILFEKHYAHDRLQLKGSYRVQQFVDPLTKTKKDKNKRAGSIATITLEEASGGARGIHKPSDIATLALDEYGQPDHDIFPTIDSARKPNLLFQIASGKSHGSNIDGLIAAIAALNLKPTDPPPCLYFVVPPDQFVGFKIGAFWATEPKAPADGSAPLAKLTEADIPNNVQFWVLELYRKGAEKQSAEKRGAAAAASALSLPPTKKQATGTAGNVAAASVLALSPITRDNLVNPDGPVPTVTRTQVPIHIQKTDKWVSQARKFIKDHPEYHAGWDNIRTVEDGALEFTVEGTTWSPL